MSWPLSQDYNEAIQTPRSSFADPELRRGEAATNALGLPMPYSGNFADVYQVRCPDGKSWAVKCFTRQAEGLRERYQEISKHLKQAKLPFTVDFTYLEQGIRVAGQWYPVLKMQWVEGLTLNQFVAQHLDKPAMLESLFQIWGRMARYLRTAEVGHCDLQHGNVLLAPGAGAHSVALKLIDYDGMWVPSLAGRKSGEVGHPCYQHPQRAREETYSPDVDRFSLLLVAAALRALKTAGKPLWEKYDNGDNLLFKEADLEAPTKSALFHDLLHSSDPLTASLAAHLSQSLGKSLESAPLLDEILPDVRAAATPAPSKIMRPAPVAATKRPSRLGPPAPPATMPAVAAAQPADAAAAGALDFGGAATVGAPPSRRKQAGDVSPQLKVWIGAAAAAVVIVLGLLGGLAVWALSAPAGQPKQAADSRGAAPTPPAPAPPEGEFLVLRIDPQGADVWVDGEKQTVDVPGGDQPVEIRVQPGQHTVTVGKDGFKTATQQLQVGAGQRLPVRVRLAPIKKPVLVKLEGEGMIPLRSNTVFPERQDMKPQFFHDGKWSGDAQLWWKPQSAGSFLELQVPVPADGTYQAVVSLTKARDYGVVQFSMNGKPLGDPIDCFEPEKVLNTGEIDLGTVDLKEGDAVLRVDVTGTNEKSVGIRYMFGLDYLELRPAAVTPPPSPTTDGVPPDAGDKPPPGDTATTPVPVAVPLPADPDGFTPLFDGKDLAGWSVDLGGPEQWTVEGGTVVGSSDVRHPRSYLLSAKEYADFTLRMEYLVDPGSSGAVTIRAAEKEKLPSGSESLPDHPLFKLSDSAKFPEEPSGTTLWVKNDRMKPPQDLKLPAGEWHRLEMTVRGESCVASLDGKPVLDVRTDALTKVAGYTPALKRARGKVGFQALTGIVRFRNIAIKELPPASP